FSGLCAIEQWYDPYIMTLRARLPVAPKRQNSKHVMFLRGHLLIWAWVACGEQYGITLDQVKNVMCHWATHAAKLPEAMISGDAHDIVGCNISWKNANDIVDCNISRKSEAIRHIKAALRGLREKRQQARTLSKSLPLPFADYEEYHHLILSGLVNAMDEEEQKRKLDAGFELEGLQAALLTTSENILDCLQSHQNTFDDSAWYHARDLVRELWEFEPSSQEQSPLARLLSTSQTLVMCLMFIKCTNLLDLRAKTAGRSKQRGAEIESGSWLSIYPAYRKK